MDAFKKNETSRVILSTDEGIVESVSVKGWKDIHGKIHLSEYFAKEASITHRTCTCGKVYPIKGSRSNTICNDCFNENITKRYNALPYKEWDGKTPLYSDLCDKYFFDADELLDYCYDEEIDISTLRLIICEPNYYREINADYWADEMSEDQEDIDSTLKEELNKLNQLIKTLPPLSWSPSKYRTDYNDSIAS